MFKEGPGPEILDNKQKVANFLAVLIPGYSEREFNEPVGDDQTSLNEFLQNKREGSEWTEPHGPSDIKIKINVINGQYQVTVTKSFN